MVSVINMEGNHLAAICNLYLSVYGLDQYPQADLLIAIADKHSVFGFVLSLEEELEGFIIIQHTQDEAEIIDMIIASAHRCKGFGGLLMQKAIDMCVAEEKKRLYLEVSDDNHIALQLYKKMGFKIIARRQHYYQQNGKKTDALIMELPL